MIPSANRNRIAEDLWAISDIGRNGNNGELTRLAYSAEEDAAFDYVCQKATEIGLRVKADAFGNLFCLRPTESMNRPIILGSHLDTVEDGGAYDGTVGVIAAIEVMRILRETGQLDHLPVCAAVFRAEEATRFGYGDLGSRLAFGLINIEDAKRIHDSSGVCLASLLSRYQVNASVDVTTEWISHAECFLEIHIEQGPILSNRGLHIGVVESIAACERYLLRVIGQAAHSGATTFPLRRDALVAASRIVGMLDDLFRRAFEAGLPTVATIGRIVALHGSINRVCGTVELDVDIRDSDAERRAAFADQFLSGCTEVCCERGLSFESKLIQKDCPVVLSPEIVTLAEQACSMLGIEHCKLTSGAAHDALVAALSNVPSGMLFVPSVNGISHCPQEETSLEDIAHAVRVAICMLKSLKGAALSRQFSNPTWMQ
jgi:hydantoinase/carbamoylase family amidase